MNLNEQLLSKLDINTVIRIFNRELSPRPFYLDNNIKYDMPKYSLSGAAKIIGNRFFATQILDFGRFRASLTFHSYDKLASLNFKEFIKVIKSNQDKYIIHLKDGTYNLSDNIFNNNELYFQDIIVDSELLKDIQNNFRDIEQIHFGRCSFAPNCRFDNLSHQKISFWECDIDHFDMLSLSNNNYEFNSCNIDIKSCFKLYSEDISFSWCNIDFKKLFLMVSAPNLTKIFFHCHNNNLVFLDFFAPNLENFGIHSFDSFESLDFLIPLKRATQIVINDGIYNLNEESGPEVHQNKLEELKRRNKNAFEIEDVLSHGDVSSVKLGNIEINRIRELNAFYKKIMMSKSEEEALRNKFDMRGMYFNSVRSKNFVRLNEGYYRFDYDGLFLCYGSPSNHDNYLTRKKFILINNILSMDYYRMVFMNKPILKAINYLLYLDGRPILMDGKNELNRAFKNKEEALEWYNSVTGGKEYKSIKIDNDYFLNLAIEKIMAMEERLTKGYDYIKFDDVDESLPFGAMGERIEYTKELEDTPFEHFNFIVTEEARIPFNDALYQKLKDEYGDNLDYFYKYIEQYFNLNNKRKELENSCKKNNRDLEMYIDGLMPHLTIEEAMYLLKVCDLYDEELDNIINQFGIIIDMDSVSIESITDKYGPDVMKLYHSVLQSKKNYDDILTQEIIVKKEDIAKLAYTKKKTN